MAVGQAAAVAQLANTKAALVSQDVAVAVQGTTRLVMAGPTVQPVLLASTKATPDDQVAVTAVQDITRHQAATLDAAHALQDNIKAVLVQQGVRVVEQVCTMLRQCI